MFFIIKFSETMLAKLFPKTLLDIYIMKQLLILFFSWNQISIILLASVSWHKWLLRSFKKVCTTKGKLKIFYSCISKRPIGWRMTYVGYIEHLFIDSYCILVTYMFSYDRKTKDIDKNIWWKIMTIILSIPSSVVQ